MNMTPRCYRPRPVPRKLCRSKKLNPKTILKHRNWRNWEYKNVTNGPTSHLPPLASKYCTFSFYQSSHASLLGAGQCKINQEMAYTLFWIINKFNPPEIHFLPKPWKPPDGLITDIIFQLMVTASFGLMLTGILTDFYARKITLWLQWIGNWIVREVPKSNYFPRGLILYLKLIDLESASWCYFCPSTLPRFDCATPLQIPVITDTIKVGFLAPPELERRMETQTNDFNSDFDFVDPESLLGKSHFDTGLVVEGWFYFDAEDKILTHSAELECKDTNPAGAEKPHPDLERVKDVNPDPLWGNPFDSQLSNVVFRSHPKADS